MKKIKPFLLLQLRPEDEASDNELEAFLKFSGLNREDIKRVRMEKDSIPEININEYSGIMLAGGPSNVSDKKENKPNAQKRFETELHNLLEKIVSSDFPFLGACYGIGALTKFLGGEVSKDKYSEAVGAVTIYLTDEAKSDKLTEGLPSNFKAFAGHKEACQNMPKGAVLLASSESCPIQMIRFKQNIYATQFHTELDQPGLELRINIYRHAGYFPPEDADILIAESKHEVITVPAKILKNFVEHYSVVA